MAARICVYTCLMGNSEALNEQPFATSSDIPFICFTDDSDLRSNTWDVRVVPRLFGTDSVRSQRAVKILPYEFLPDFDASLYIDNSVLLAQAPEALVERNFPASGFCLVEHSYRATVLDEFLEVAALGLDDKGRIFEQLKHYTEECPAVLQEKPYWGAILLRDHGHATVRKMLEIWFTHVQRYSRRDQLSVNLAFRLAGLVPDVLRFDNYKSEYHSWPHKTGGNQRTHLRQTSNDAIPLGDRIDALEIELLVEKQRTEALRASLAQLDQALAAQKQHYEARLVQNGAALHAAAQLGQALADERRRNEALLASTSWRVTAPLRGLSRIVRNFARRGGN
jgi:TOD1/MUCI70, glycosyltransferase-like domain